MFSESLYNSHILSRHISQNCVLCLSLNQPQAGRRVSVMTGSDLRWNGHWRCPKDSLQGVEPVPLGHEATGKAFCHFLP